MIRYFEIEQNSAYNYLLINKTSNCIEVKEVQYTVTHMSVPSNFHDNNSVYLGQLHFILQHHAADKALL